MSKAKSQAASNGAATKTTAPKRIRVYMSQDELRVFNEIAANKGVTKSKLVEQWMGQHRCDASPHLVDLSLFTHLDRRQPIKDIPNAGYWLRVVLWAGESESWTFPRYIAATQDGRFFAVDAPDGRQRVDFGADSNCPAVPLTPAEVLHWIALAELFGCVCFATSNVMLFTETMLASLKEAA